MKAKDMAGESTEETIARLRRENVALRRLLVRATDGLWDPTVDAEAHAFIAAYPGDGKEDG